MGGRRCGRGSTDPFASASSSRHPKRRAAPLSSSGVVKNLPKRRDPSTPGHTADLPSSERKSPPFSPTFKEQAGFFVQAHTTKRQTKVTVDGTNVLSKSGRFAFDWMNHLPWQRPTDDGYEVHVVQNGIEPPRAICFLPQEPLDEEAGLFLKVGEKGGLLRAEDGRSAVWPGVDGSLRFGTFLTTPEEESGGGGVGRGFMGSTNLLASDSEKARQALLLRQELQAGREGGGEGGGKEKEGEAGPNCGLGASRPAEPARPIATENAGEVCKVTVDGTNVLSKSGRFAFDWMNHLPWQRPTDDGYEVHVVQDGIEARQQQLSTAQARPRAEQPAQSMLAKTKGGGDGGEGRRGEESGRPDGGGMSKKSNGKASSKESSKKK
eukprot:jgi/Undpi1/4618/HiC_scaffold_18.g07972.m1